MLRYLSPYIFANLLKRDCIQYGGIQEVHQNSEKRDILYTGVADKAIYRVKYERVH